MSQHDMVIDNGPGLAVRTDFNAAVQALASMSSGPVEPTTKYPGQFWLDTTIVPNGQLRQRNLANTAWVDPTFALSASFALADIGFGARTGPNRFVWNDKADLTGSDVAELTEAGVPTFKGSFVVVQGSIANPNPSFLFKDTAGTTRGYFSRNLANNDVTLTVNNASEVVQENGPIWSGGNCPITATGNGYQKLKSGLIIQWGSSTNAAADYPLTFPIAFPNALLSLVANNTFAPGANTFLGVALSDVTLTGFNVRCRSITGGAVTGTTNAPIKWMALGV